MQQRVLFLTLFLSSFVSFASDTELKLYRPFEAPIIKQKLKGSCDVQSKLIIREDAWRCYAEGKTYDPCFASAEKKHKKVLCPASPWSEDTVQITLNQQLDNSVHQSLDMSRAFPWAIELSNGDKCQAIEEGGQFDSMPVRYHCLSSSILVGTIQRCNPAWSMLEKRKNEVVTTGLKTVWF